jgi:hypothetical protein
MTARTTQPRSSKGPLGERGRRLQERPGVVPLAAITRRGAVPIWLRASWSGPLAAAKAASQPANCRRHVGWSRSPSPRTRWGTRSLICARFQPDWGKPNVRLIGGREETGASRIFRAARGASRLPDQHAFVAKDASVAPLIAGRKQKRHPLLGLRGAAAGRRDPPRSAQGPHCPFAWKAEAAAPPRRGC